MKVQLGTSAFLSGSCDWCCHPCEQLPCLGAFVCSGFTRLDYSSRLVGQDTNSAKDESEEHPNG